jgi:hypothetical protein
MDWRLAPEVLDLDVVVAGRELGLAALVRHRVRAAVVDDHLPPDGQPGAVVGGREEPVRPRFFHAEGAGPADVEVALQLAAVKVAADVAVIDLLLDAHQERLGRLRRKGGDPLEVLGDEPRFEVDGLGGQPFGYAQGQRNGEDQAAEEHHEGLLRQNGIAPICFCVTAG